MTLALAPRDVHLWWVRPERAGEPALAAYAALLAPEERARWERLRRPEARRDFLVTRALVRTTLSRYAPVAPAAWRFSAGAHGRPEIASPRVALRFNLSHTAGLVVCAVARGRAVGVDVEDTRRRSRTDALAARFFAPAEVATLRALAPRARRARFFECWTLKESYLKARGLGLRLPLARFAFRVDGRRRVRVAFDRGLGDDPRRWLFTLLRPTAHHVIAVSVRRPPGVPIRMQSRETVPPTSV